MVQSVLHGNGASEGENGVTLSQGLHSMVLIGSGIEEDKTWLLIQNTWTNMPIFEASVEYLAHHFDGQQERGTLVFLEGDSSDIPCDVTRMGLILETTYDDAGDCIEERDENDYGLKV